MRPVSIRLPVICVVTRARGVGGSSERRTLLGRLAAAAAAGATMVQIRERQLDDRQLRQFTQDVASAVRPAGALVLVNERTDVALAAGADGVHLKSNAPSATDVREVVPSGFVIGQSVHSAIEAATAESAGGCDYLLFGTVFPSSSKPPDHPVAGVAALAEVCRRVRIPVVAIGGISIDTARQVARAGAAGIAAISVFADAADVEQTVRALADALTPSRENV